MLLRLRGDVTLDTGRQRCNGGGHSGQERGKAKAAAEEVSQTRLVVLRSLQSLDRRALQQRSRSTHSTGIG